MTYESGRRLRPDDHARRDVVAPSFQELVVGLREILGVRLVAYIGGVKDAKRVTQWADGATAPVGIEQQRLQGAFQVATLLADRYDPITIQSWFKGMNPLLDDEAPAMVLRHGDPLEAGKQVLVAAFDFAYVN